MGNKDALYDKYILDNSQVFLKFSGVRIERGNTILLFEGVDIYDNEIILEQDLQKHNLGNITIYSEEEFTLKEFKIDNYNYVEIYMRERGSTKRINIYDWL